MIKITLNLALTGVLALIISACTPKITTERLLNTDFNTDSYVYKYQFVYTHLDATNVDSINYWGVKFDKYAFLSARIDRIMIVTDKKYVWQIQRYFATNALYPRLKELAFCKRQDSVLRLSMMPTAPPVAANPLNLQQVGNQTIWQNYLQTEYGYEYTPAFRAYQASLDKWKGIRPLDTFTILIPSKFPFKNYFPQEAVAINMPSYMERRGSMIYQHHYVSYDKDSVQAYFSLNKRDTVYIKNYLNGNEYCSAKSNYQGKVKIKLLDRVYTCYKVSINVKPKYANDGIDPVSFIVTKYYHTENFIPLSEKTEINGTLITDALKSMESVLDCKCYDKH